MQPTIERLAEQLDLTNHKAERINRGILWGMNKKVVTSGSSQPTGFLITLWREGVDLAELTVDLSGKVTHKKNFHVDVKNAAYAVKAFFTHYKLLHKNNSN